MSPFSLTRIENLFTARQVDVNFTFSQAHFHQSAGNDKTMAMTSP